ncbi:MAG: ABC transporter substrate-binding protein [Proteobacteria bacterium]|nr:ABC transporter substrate-binding protein [Pseudomonadota bacterium]
MSSKILIAFSFISLVILMIYQLYFNDEENNQHQQKISKYTTGVLIVGTSADYKPFEFQENDKIVGFDIDLAREIAKHLKMELQIKNMPFYAIIAALQSKKIDLALSAMSKTKKRSKSMSFSSIYHNSDFALLLKKNTTIDGIVDMNNKRIGAQTASTMETFLKENAPSSVKIISQDDNNQLIENLKIDRLDGVLLEIEQAIAYLEGHYEFTYVLIPESKAYGFAVAMPLESELVSKVNEVLEMLEDNGFMNYLRKKWIKGANANLNDENQKIQIRGFAFQND